MSSRSPQLAELLNEYVKEGLATLNVHLPGKIVKWNASKQLADVQPLLKRPYEDENGDRQVESLNVITNVPVLMPGTHGYRLTMPVAVGDFVWLGFADRSLDVWLASADGREVDPQFTGNNELSDAVAWLGLHPNSMPWTGVRTDAITLGKDGGPQIHCESSTIRLGASTSTEAVILGTTFLTALSTLVSAIGVALPAAATACTTFTNALASYKSSTVKTS